MSEKSVKRLRAVLKATGQKLSNFSWRRFKKESRRKGKDFDLPAALQNLQRDVFFESIRRLTPDGAREAIEGLRKKTPPAAIAFERLLRQMRKEIAK